MAARAGKLRGALLHLGEAGGVCDESGREEREAGRGCCSLGRFNAPDCPHWPHAHTPSLLGFLLLPQVLDAVPWVAPRPLFLLATEQRQQPSMSAAAAAAVRFGSNASPGLTYSLRTRVAKAEAADELSMVLKKRSADGSALISCSEMKDGVVAFEDEADAERYRQQLEAEGSEEVGGCRGLGVLWAGWAEGHRAGWG